ncbi:hypothetical protein K456DRAFT_647329 [Colletotrichum gloeosporioides 23]|nr:hypothetical protein K456DRAFT_647329 [Colletotrichum gloeosporioides 23]
MSLPCLIDVASVHTPLLSLLSHTYPYHLHPFPFALAEITGWPFASTCRVYFACRSTCRPLTLILCLQACLPCFHHGHTHTHTHTHTWCIYLFCK